MWLVQLAITSTMEKRQSELELFLTTLRMKMLTVVHHSNRVVYNDDAIRPQYLVITDVASASASRARRDSVGKK